MSPDQYCRDRTGGALSDVFFCVLFAPSSARRAVTALRALQREVGEIAIECVEADVAYAKLRWWHSEIDDLYAGGPRHPVSRALEPHVRRHGLPREYFEQFIEGTAEDIRRRRYASFSDLSVHFVHTAGSIGLLEATALGFRDKRTTKFAHFLAQGSELTRAIRHLGRHVRAGRMYLPDDDLDTFGVTDADILRARTGDAVVRLLASEVERCAALFREALAHLPADDRKAQTPGLVRMALDLDVLAEIRRGGYRVLEHRTELTPARKLRLAWRVHRSGLAGHTHTA
jgi:phytoene synthase